MQNPVTAAEFTACISQLDPGTRIAVAISGGPDSMALALLAHAWARRHKREIAALTVDHGLRRESAREARQVASWMRALGITHHTLRWNAPRARQLDARNARYELLAQWCHAHGYRDLLLAHHRDDQAETVLLRLKRGSHVEGLAGMSAIAERHGIRLLRPLLAFPKSRLIATLGTHPYVTDPGNASTEYDRSRLRTLMAALPNEERLLHAIADSAARLGHLRIAREAELNRWLTTHVRCFSEGYALIDRNAFALAEADLRLRAFSALLTTISGEEYPPRFEQLETLAAQLLHHGFLRATLHGCVVGAHNSAWLISREARAVPATTRFTITLTGSLPRNLEVRALGAEGVRQLKAMKIPLPASLPKPVLPTLPAFWQLEGLRGVPHIHYQDAKAGWQAEVKFTPAKPLASAPFYIMNQG